MTKIRTGLWRAFLTPISPALVFLSGFYSFMWGLWVAIPAWETFPKSPIYGVLAWTGSELVWGTAQMLVGLALISASFDSIKFMKWATFAGFISWILIALAFMFADWHNAGMWVAGYIAATNAYMFLNLAKRDD